MENLVQVETLIIELFLVITLVALAARRLRIPYTMALVLTGLALTAQGMFRIELTPELVLALFLPPLLFEAAFHLQLRQLLEDLPLLLLLAVPGLLLGAVLVGLGLSRFGILSWTEALLFGVLISATDPVAVVTTFKALGAPRRLSTLVEGESLLNDGTAVVLFGIVLALARGGDLDVAEGLREFFRVALGGLAVGAILGQLVARLIARVDDYLIEISLTTVLAYGSYLLAEYLHVSGVLAVVAAGLTNGNLGTQGMSATTRIVLTHFWEYVAFLANSFVFILIGLAVDVELLLLNVTPILITVGIVLAARGLVVYGLSALARWGLRSRLPWRYIHVLWWGGLRGAVGLALALGLPPDFSARGALQVLAFGVVLFTLLVQAPTAAPLLRRLGLTAHREEEYEYEWLQGRILALRAAREQLARMYRRGALTPQVWETVSAELEQAEQEAAQALHAYTQANPQLMERAMGAARREALRTQRAALLSLAQEGVLAPEVADSLIAEVDRALEEIGYNE